MTGLLRAPSRKRIAQLDVSTTDVGPRGKSLRRSTDWSTITIALSVVAVNVFVLNHSSLPFIEPAFGFWFIIILPVYLLYTTSVWTGCSEVERLGYCVSVVLLILITCGLAINALLPLLSVHRPLDTVPVLAMGDVINVSLYMYRRPHSCFVSWRRLSRLSNKEACLLTIGLLSVLLAVLGANRLNNGLSDQLSLVAIGGVLITIVCQVLWAHNVREGVICTSVYVSSLALLLSTSLRGWYVTGHDIQNEYRVFQLTAGHGHWSMSYWHNAYNACLSITILPTEISRIIGIDSPYLFKVVFQLLFATCPVLVYATARRYWSPSIAVLATAYFTGFPTFFTDMPFLNRQEIAYLFIAAGILVVTNPAWSRRKRQIAFLLAGVGVELSHYSSMYFLVAVLGAAWMARQAVGMADKLLGIRSAATRRFRPRGAVMGCVVTLNCLLGFVFVIYLWGGLATQTSGQVVTTVKAVASALSSHVSANRSRNVGYSLFAGKTPSQQTLLKNLRVDTLRSDSTAPRFYVSLKSLSKVVTPASVDPVRPLTSVGRTLMTVGVPVVESNSLLRALTAYGEQIFVGIGLLELLIALRRRCSNSEEYVWLCVGCTVVVALITILPGVSSDYGVLRAFQGALIVVAPVIAIGSTSLIRWIGQSRAAALTGPAICTLFFTVTSSLLPQVIGGNPPELNLNNSGIYYDAYYVHPQEEAAVGWLARQRDVLSDGIQGSYQQYRFAFMGQRDVNGGESIGNIFPTLIRRSSWVIVNYSMVHGDMAVVRVDGNLIEYRYPLKVLESNKNLVYSNGSAELYR